MIALNQKFFDKPKFLCCLPQILLAISCLGMAPPKALASEMTRAEAAAILFSNLHDETKPYTNQSSKANPPAYFFDDLDDLDCDLVNTIKDLVIAAGSFELSTEELKAELNKLNSNLKYTLFPGKQRKDFTRNDYIELHAQWVRLINSKFFVRKNDFEVLEANKFPNQDQETQFELLPLLSIYIKLIGFCDDANTQEKVTSIESTFKTLIRFGCDKNLTESDMADFSQDAAGNPGHPLAVAVSLPQTMKIRENLLRILTDDRLTYGHNIKLPEKNQLSPIRSSLNDEVVKGLLEIQATKVDPLAFRTTLRYVTASNFGRLENKDPALSNEPPYYALTLYTDGAVVKDQYWSRLLEQLLVQADHYTKKYRVTGYDSIGNSVTFDLMERFYLHPTVKNQLKDKKFSERFGAEFIKQVQFTFASKVIPDVVAEYDAFREATNETTGGEYEIFNTEDVKRDIIEFFKILDMISALSVNFNRFALDKAAQDEHLKLLKLARFMALSESSNDEAQIFAVYKRYGLDVEVFAGTQIYDHNPLVLAAQMLSPILPLLLRLAPYDIKHRDGLGLNILHFIFSLDKDKIKQYQIDDALKLEIERLDNVGLDLDNPMSYAIKSLRAILNAESLVSDVDAAKAMIAKSNVGKTPIYMAAEKENWEAVLVMINLLKEQKMFQWCHHRPDAGHDLEYLIAKIPDHILEITDKPTTQVNEGEEFAYPELQEDQKRELLKLREQANQELTDRFYAVKTAYDAKQEEDKSLMKTLMDHCIYILKRYEFLEPGDVPTIEDPDAKYLKSGALSEILQPILEPKKIVVDVDDKEKPIFDMIPLNHLKNTMELPPSDAFKILTIENEYDERHLPLGTAATKLEMATSNPWCVEGTISGNGKDYQKGQVLEKAVCNYESSSGTEHTANSCCVVASNSKFFGGKIKVLIPVGGSDAKKFKINGDQVVADSFFVHNDDIYACPTEFRGEPLTRDGIKFSYQMPKYIVGSVHANGGVVQRSEKGKMTVLTPSFKHGQEGDHFVKDYGEYKSGWYTIDMTDKDNPKVYFHWKNEFRDGQEFTYENDKGTIVKEGKKVYLKVFRGYEKRKIQMPDEIGRLASAQEGVLFTYLKPVLEKAWQNMIKHERQSKLMFDWMYKSFTDPDAEERDYFLKRFGAKFEDQATELLFSIVKDKLRKDETLGKKIKDDA